MNPHNIEGGTEMSKHTAMVRAYRRYEDWAKRSGFASLGWLEFKRSRSSNPLARAAIAKAEGRS